MKIIVLLSVLFFSINSLACIPEGSDNDSKDEFILSVVDGLVYIKESEKEIDKTYLKVNKPLSLMDTFVNLKKSILKKECALKHIERFLKSKNEDIKLASSGMNSSINSLIQGTQDIIDSYKMDNLTEVEMADRMSNISVKNKESWKTLTMAVIFSTYIVPGKEDTKTSEIKKSTVKESLKKIKENFTKKELKEKKEAVDLMASSIVDILSEDWKFK